MMNRFCHDGCSPVKVATSLVVAFLLAVLCLAENVAAIEQDELRQVGRMVGAFFDGEAAGTRRYFTPGLAGKYSEKQLLKMRASLVERGGGVRYVEIPYIVRESILADGKTPSATVATPVDLENMSVEVVVVWTGAFGLESITGFAVRPVSRDKADLNIRREMYRYTTPSYITGSGFTESQVPITGSRDKAPVSAFLCQPVKSSNVTQYPAVVFLPDHAMEDADGTIGPNKIYRDMAQALAEKGIITLRMSPRWLVDPELQSGSYTYREEIVDDVRSAIYYMHQRRDVLPGAVYLVGFDYGGYIASSLCGEKDLMRGLVLLSPQDDYSAASMVERMEFEGTNAGYTDKDWSITKGKLGYIEKESLRKQEEYLGRPAGYWYSLQEVTLFKSLKEFEKPVLILFGENDYYLTEDKLAPWVVLAKENRHIDIRVFPELNRWMIPSRDGGSLAEKEMPGHVSPDVVEMLLGAVKNDSNALRK